MYTLLSGLYKHLTQKEEYCVVILGLDNAGKSVSNIKIIAFLIILGFYWRLTWLLVVL